MGVFIFIWEGFTDNNSESIHINHSFESGDLNGKTSDRTISTSHGFS